jgi:hypothetical protein
VILSAHGVRIELPAGWSGRVFSRSGQAATLHAGNFPVSLNEMSTFGDRSTGRMPAGGAFLALTEYLPGAGLEPGVGLFAPSRLRPPLDPTAFSRRKLAHARPGQLGMQHFFTAGRRPFCLYLVISGDRATRRRQLVSLDHVLGTLRIESR